MEEGDRYPGILCLHGAGDPTLVVRQDLPPSRAMRSLLNLWDRAEAADQIGDLQAVLADLIAWTIERQLDEERKLSGGRER